MAPTVAPPTEPPTLPSGATDKIPDLGIRARYDNFIGGRFVPPTLGRYFTNVTPVTGQPLCDVAPAALISGRRIAGRASQSGSGTGEVASCPGAGPASAARADRGPRW